MLNPFAILGGVLSLVALSLHGAAYLAMKTTGVLQGRARALVGPLWIALVVALAAIVAASFVVRPDFSRNFARWPVLAAVPAIAVAGVAGIRLFLALGDDTRVFLSSAAAILGVLGSASAGLFPRLLPTIYGTAYQGLDIYNAASAPHSLRIALVLYAYGLVLVSIYLDRFDSRGFRSTAMRPAVQPGPTIYLHCSIFVMTRDRKASFRLSSAPASCIAFQVARARPYAEQPSAR